jgi:hypothetical protein
MSSLTRLRFLLRSSGQRIHALAFGGARHAAQTPSLTLRDHPRALMKHPGFCRSRRRPAAARA